jgi:hypothetical protein
MDYAAAKQGGYRCISGEALPAVSASTQIFANAPAGTTVVELTVRAQALRLTFDGTTAATATVGQDYPIGNHRLFLNSEQAKRVRAIQAAATATGYITYFTTA